MLVVDQPVETFMKDIAEGDVSQGKIAAPPNKKAPARIHPSSHSSIETITAPRSHQPLQKLAVDAKLLSDDGIELAV